VSREGQGSSVAAAWGWVSYDLLRKESNTFSHVAAYSINSGGYAYGRGDDTMLVPFGAATWDLFPLLGVQPVLGRFFNDAEDSPSAPQRVVVLGYGFWTRAFARERDVIGRRITLGNQEFEIIGVAPRGFTGPQLSPVDAWIPLSLTSQRNVQDFPTNWNAQWMRVIARLKDGVSPEQAGTSGTTLYQGEYAGRDPAQKTAKVWVGPLDYTTAGKEAVESTISRWLIGVTLVVLLIACANVANLLLARAVRRRREVAVRIALGAGRGRLVRLLLTESVLLSGLGAVAGLLVAWGTAILMRNLLLPGLEWPHSPLDWRVLMLSAAIGIAVGLLTGLAPALRATDPNLTGALKAGARGGGVQASRLRASLTIAQAALSIVLLAGAGLFVRSLAKVREIDLGLQPDRVLVVQLNYATQGGPMTTPQGRAEFARRKLVLEEAMLRARQLPSVEQSSLSVGLAFQTGYSMYMRVPGWDSIPQFRNPGPNVSAISPDYFETVGSRVVAGRGFTDADRAGSESVVLVSRSMARNLWPNRSPIGDCFQMSVFKDSVAGAPCAQVVGIVADAHAFGLKEEPDMHYYIPYGQEKGMGGPNLLVRPRQGAESEVIAEIRRLMPRVDPGVTFVSARYLQESIDPMVRPWKLGATMFTLLGVLALVVAAVGLYSVMSYLVAQRTQEIGVRIALGARSSNIVSLILRGSVGMAAAGLVIGTVITLATGRFIQPLLFETSAKDPIVLAGVAAVLLVVAIAASVVPALRAKRVDSHRSAEGGVTNEGGYGISRARRVHP
jgi:predicted permease